MHRSGVSGPPQTFFSGQWRRSAADAPLRRSMAPLRARPRDRSLPTNRSADFQGGAFRSELVRADLEVGAPLQRAGWETCRTCPVEQKQEALACEDCAANSTGRADWEACATIPVMPPLPSRCPRSPCWRLPDPPISPARRSSGAWDCAGWPCACFADCSAPSYKWSRIFHGSAA